MPDGVKLPNGTVIYDNMSQASAAMNVPMRVLKKSKKMGCPAFRASRVYHQDFVDWYGQHKSEVDAEAEKKSLEDLKAEKMEVDIRLALLEEKRRKKEYLDPQDVKALLQTIGTSQAAVLKRVPAEYPQKLAGKTTAEIEVILTKMVGDLVQIFHQALDQWK